MKHKRNHALPDIEIALQHHRAGRLQRAEALYEKMPGNPDAMHLRGIIAHQLNKNSEAIALITEAINADPSNAAYCSSIEFAYRALNRLDDVIACYQKLLVHAPDNVDARGALGRALEEQGRLDEAADCYRRALALKPDLVDLHYRLGSLFHLQNKLDDAVACYRNALMLEPGNAAMHTNLGNALRAQHKFDEAKSSYLQAIALKPDLAEAHGNLGLTLMDLGHLDHAIGCYEAALALKPDFAEAHSNQGIALHRQGMPDEALVCYKKALALKPDFTDAYQSLLFSMLCSARYSPAEIFAEHQRFAQQFETPLKPGRPGHSNSRDPRKRLKIGYVSPDFRNHPVAIFMEPVLACHDKLQFEVFCYYNHACVDAVTQRIRALADHWVQCQYLSDEQLTTQIRADGIDILVDLSGHTVDNRLLTFARKPAPVQASYLGYPATTGLTAIDYRITDVHAEPSGMTEQLNVEQLWRLPDIFCCYRAHDNSPDVIDHPPADDNGHITFGCFNNFAKVTDPVLVLWARLLEKVPSARLLLEIHGIDNPERRAQVEGRLARLGLPLDRMILVPRKPENQYVLYNHIDIALDPFPCNGGTTSLDTLWMGVPFVTLAGRHFTSRMGVTILTNAGLPELIAQTEEEYVDIAAALALDPARLNAIRSGLRGRVQASPLMDAPRFTMHLEQAYRDMWNNWCRNAPAEENTDCEADDAAALNNAGNALRGEGKLDDAVATYRHAIAVNPGMFEAHYNLGIALHDQGKADDAILSYQGALAVNPDFAAAHHGIALVYSDQDKFEAAIEHYRKAIALAPRFAVAYNNLGNALRAQGKLDDATQCYKNAIDIEPDFAEAYSSLGATFHLQGKTAEAAGWYRKALAKDPNCQSAQNNLGSALYEQGLFDDAIACYQHSIALNPEDPCAHYNLGNAYSDQGKLSEAISCYLQAIALKLDYAQAYNSLGIVFALKEQFGEAISCYETAIALQQDFPDPHNNLGNLLGDQGKITEARECFQAALKIKPDFAEAYGNLGRTYHQQSKPDGAIACYRQALAHKPGYPDAYGNLLLAMQYSSTCTPEEVHAEHVRFAAQFEAPLKAHWSTYPNPRDPRKRLKIGYVSPDFNRHAVSYFIEPVLALHDKSQVEIFCYYNHNQYGPVTERLQALADHWIPCKHLSDDQLAAQIRTDGIDILIDLAGHTGGNRLLTFARKPAPVQATYLGYPATTGLTAIDYRITDVHAEPPGMTEQLNVEQLWRLPDIFCCYRAHDNSPDVIDHPPAADNGHVTFGCFNNFAKVTDPVLVLWARLLEKVPTAHLLLEIHGIDDPVFRAEIEGRLARLGLPLDRVILVPRKPENQYVLYNHIDIALDPFPCNGGTTSLDTLWMGVPFVTLAGRHFTSRMGVTILTNAGLPELIAQTEEEYVDIAAALALDPARLNAIRSGLRGRVQASPLMDAQRFTMHLEQAYRDMWNNWCQKVSNQEEASA
jgi:predicted O-linked N-acetylglucosamine transferase (SPINDLY family)